MIWINIICVGKMKEKYYIAAAAEYVKRLGAYCRLTITEIPETQLPKEPSGAEISAALEAEARRMEIPERAAVFALCVEGRQMSSEKLAENLLAIASRGISRLVFIIGGSNGLAERIKDRADYRLSMSEMTFPHHLARVMLLEQIYRAFNISEGGKYHK